MFLHIKHTYCRRLGRRLNEKGIEYYVERTAEAKAALTAPDKYVPEVRERITSGWELREDDEPSLRRAIEQRRSDALKAKRLFVSVDPCPERVPGAH